MTREEALEITRHYHLEEEVEFAMNQGMTPEEALASGMFLTNQQLTRLLKSEHQ